MTFALIVFALALLGCVVVDRAAPEPKRSLSPSALSSDAELPDPAAERREAAEARGGFDVVLRGYRMDQVDRRISGLESDYAELEAEKSQLESENTALRERLSAVSAADL